MKSRMEIRWGVVIVTGVALAGLLMSSAHAQERRGRMGMNRAEMFGRMLCDVEGLWFSASFDAKLDAAALDKLKPICQKAYDARSKELTGADIGDFRELAMTVKGIGDDMEKSAKETLGANASKVNWFAKRDAAMKELEERFENGGGRNRGPQPTPVQPEEKTNPAPSTAPAPSGTSKRDDRKN